MCVQVLESYSRCSSQVTGPTRSEFEDFRVQNNIFNVSLFPATTRSDFNTSSFLDFDNPYVAAMVEGKKWGNIDPDEEKTNLKYYIFDDESLDFDYEEAPGIDQALPVLSEERQAMLGAMESFSNVRVSSANSSE